MNFLRKFMDQMMNFPNIVTEEIIFYIILEFIFTISMIISN